MKGAMQAVKEFFDLPIEEKNEINFHKSPFFRGYEEIFATRHQQNGHGGTYPRERVLVLMKRRLTPRTDKKEAFTLTYDDRQPPHNQWPANHPDFRKVMVEYHTALCQLAKQMYSAFGSVLELPEYHFESVYEECNSSVRALHYPPQQPQETDEVGFGAHTDTSWFTLLNQDNVGALEVQNANGEWIPVAPIENTFVVNIGDFLQFVSNGKLKSTRHRVINRKGLERYSIAFFWLPNETDVLKVADTCREPGQAYSDMVAKDYAQRRFRGSRLSHPLLKDA